MGMVKYKVYRVNGKTFAQIWRRRWRLFGPWMEEVYDREGVWWRSRKTGRFLNDFFDAFLEYKLEREHYILEGEGR